MFPILRSSLAAIALLVATSAHATLVADYQFQGNLNSSVGAAPALTDVGAGNTFASDTVLGATRTVGTFPAFNGYALSPTTGLIANGGPYTIVITARIATQPGYSKLVDFSNGTVDAGFYEHDHTAQFYPNAGSAATVFAPNAYFQLALVRDAGGVVTSYVNGTQATSNPDAVNQYGVISAANTLRFFVDDSTTSGAEATAGAVSRIQLYNTALSAAEVQALSPFPTSVPTLAGAGRLLLALLLVGLVAAALRR
jgi:hypothetical protein